jgi:regulator of sigma E protease
MAHIFLFNLAAQAGALLAGSLPDFIRSVAAVAVMLGIMILVHEYGHFVVARAFGVRVDVFSIGFGPRIFGWRRGQTDYRLSILPLGGYVKMAGDNPVDERTGAPDEFLSKPRWQRACIAAAGPVTNILSAIVLTVGLFAFYGVLEAAYLSQPAVVAGVLKNSAAAKAGVQAGDKIVAVNGKPVATWENAQQFIRALVPGTSGSIVFERNGEKIVQSFAAPAATESLVGISGYPSLKFTVDVPTPGLPAERAGLEPDDEILSLNGQPVESWYGFSEKIQAAGGQPIDLLVRRGDKQIHLTINAVQMEQSDGTRAWKIGVSPRPASILRRLPLQEAVVEGVVYNTRFAAAILGGIGQLIAGRVSLKEMEGPVGIGRHAGQAAKRGAYDFIELMALISLNLAILNLLPIPILDGGHILLLGLESIRQRDFSIAFKERFVQVGMVFLLLLFGIVMYNDLLKLVPRKWLG